jgi:tetratricopeptide (TPR) repeat protein
MTAKHLYGKSLTYFWVSMVMVTFPFLNSWCQNDSIFALANKHYQQNEFDLAVKTYQQLIEKGIQTPEILYNLGNAHFKNGDLGYAILYYEKAKLLAPHDDDINQNLAIANARVLDIIDVIPDFFIKRWVYQLVNLLPSNTWAMIGLVTFAAMLALFMLYFFSGNIDIKRIGFYSAVGLLLVSMLTYWCSVKRKKYITGNNTAIVVEPSVSIKSSPDAEGNNVFVLHEGTKVMVADSIENWKEIRLTNGNKGWLESKAIQSI